MNHTVSFCERCCEEVSGRPPVFDYAETALFCIQKLCVLLFRFLLGAIQLIGGILFFLVAMWFVPVCGPMSQKELEYKEWKEREDAKWRERKAADDDRKRQEEDSFWGDRRAEDDRRRSEDEQYWKQRDREWEDLREENERRRQAELQAFYVAELNRMNASFDEGSSELKEDDRNVGDFNEIGKQVSEGKIDPSKAIALQSQIAQELKEERNEEEKRK